MSKDSCRRTKRGDGPQATLVCDVDHVQPVFLLMTCHNLQPRSINSSRRVLSSPPTPSRFPLLLGAIKKKVSNLSHNLLRSGLKIKIIARGGPYPLLDDRSCLHLRSRIPHTHTTRATSIALAPVGFPRWCQVCLRSPTDSDAAACITYVPSPRVGDVILCPTHYDSDLAQSLL